MNKFRKILLILTGISITACTSDKANDLTKYVDPFIGTGAPEFCDILLMPTTGKVNVLVGD
ncbi:MAG: hypothetical protein KAH07_08280, partial [Flavobacteriaceae bacterium]|nr:hypothetical protein [Flavobacteriaceae bacterium]